METAIHEAVRAAREGHNLSVIGRMKSGWVVLGQRQFISGYALLLPDPVVGSLNELATEDRAQFLLDMASLGDALLAVTGAWRINYEILGNSAPALHAHVFPRRLSEPEPYRAGPVWRYPKEDLDSVPFDPVRDRGLMDEIRKYRLESGMLLEEGI
jgi:diadenosine tetraphosphate (Ap4A) HIT family hydrolase